jgi:hypothetical protein
MATATLVITYTPATNPKNNGNSTAAVEEVFDPTDPLNVDATAYASLTADQIQKSLRLMKTMIGKLQNDKVHTIRLTGVGPQLT